MAEQGRRWSPYVYAFNNPLLFIDPDGRWPWKQLVQGRVYGNRSDGNAFSKARKNPADGVVRPHNGIDLGYHPKDESLQGGEGIHAAARGKVKTVGKSDTAGNFIIIEHSDGYTSFYAHIRDDGTLVKEGQEINDGDVIGEIGTTGRSTGNHLHFGLQKDGEWIDPTTIDDLDVYLFGSKDTNQDAMLQEVQGLLEQLQNGDINIMDFGSEMERIYYENNR